MKNIFLILPLIVIASLAICALSAMALMKLAGGAATFCIAPPPPTEAGNGK